MWEIKNKGSATSSARAKQKQADHRRLIRSLPGFATGFTVHDVPIDVATARRELQEMVKGRLLLVTVLPGGRHQYREAPRSLQSVPWVSYDNGIRLGQYQPGMGICHNIIS